VWASKTPTPFYDYKIVVVLLGYRLGAVHDVSPQATFKQAIALTTTTKEKAASVGGAAFCSGDRLNLKEPLQEFCLQFGLGSGQVVSVIASRRQLVPIISATPFCDTG
jgi:hypothetical protein